MKVLLSIKPEFANKIFDGTKKYEFRKTLFSRRDIESVIVYASFPVQAVIGEFTIAKILSNSVEEVWAETRLGAGITKAYYDEYFSSKKIANAIEIGKLNRFPQAKKLSDYNILFAPQSFVYIQ